MNPQRKSYCTQGQLTRLLTGTSVLALLVAALPAIAHADDVSRSETFGSNGKNGKAYLIGSNDPSTPGINGGTIDINNTHASTKETTNTTSVKIGSTGGDGGHGDSAGFSDVDGSPGGKGGNVTLTQRGSLAAKGNQSDSASPTLPNERTSRDPRWYQYGGNANLLVYSQGGDGGYANYSLGAGGDGGAVRLSLSDNVTTEGDRFAGVWARSLGGNAGMGGTIESYVSALGGGDGGNVATTIGNVLIGTDGLYAPAVIAESLGGHGGDRGSGFYAKPYTTVGGNGGRVSVSSYGRINTAQDYSTGILAQSVAGRGGDQGTSGGRPGAKGGNGGYVSVVNNGSVSTDGKYSFGIVAQSLGGTGGTGGAGFFGGGDGGAAGAGGGVAVTNYGSVITKGEGSIALIAQSIGGGNADEAFHSGPLTPGTASGGGGTGGKNLFIGSGGDGGTGGDGGDITALNGGSGSLSTSGAYAYGMLAQSIGGGGGDGGDAVSYAPFVSIAVGGRGGGGGNGGTVKILNEDRRDPSVPKPTINTTGKGATGIVALSVGGGGGDGGSAAAHSAGFVGSVSVGVGGAGGDGGNGGTVTVNNDSVITTEGLSALGISGKSVGGGGGDGGNASAYALAVAPPDLPSIGVTVTVGGSGGKGGDGGVVTINNTAGIHTKGSGSTGIEAMSVGGGGGSGGSAASTTDLLGAFLNLGLAVSVGGSGGDGGAGQTVNVSNNAKVETDGDYSRGILAMSVGGGGGTGGTGSAAAAPGLSWSKITEIVSENGLPLADSFSANVSVGGSGGKGGNGEAVTVNNLGSIVTQGGNAQGIFAQSVGGGGGDAAGALASGSGELTATLKIGGRLDNGGGKGGDITINNKEGATIETSGQGSAGIFAQSVGGGGGNGGSYESQEKTPLNPNDNTGQFIVQITTEILKGDKVFSQLLGSKEKKALEDYALLDKNSPLQKKVGMALNVLKIIKPLVDQDKSLGKRILEAAGTGVVGGVLIAFKNKLEEALGEISTKDAPNLPKVDLTVAIGGSGGKGGNGGDVTITNGGTVLTHGNNSWGIFAQSVGGGGGTGGAATSTGNNKVNLDLTLGASGGDGGKGGEVNVTNTGDVVTDGGASYGIFAQSVSGGGGVGGAVANANSISVSGGFRMGGDSGKSSDGAEAKVTNSGSVVTYGKEAHAIVAQSVGGGGGTFFINRVDPRTPEVLSQDPDEKEALELALALLEDFGLTQGSSVAGGSGKVFDESTTIFPMPALVASVGGNGSGGGNGGDVTISDSGDIETYGLGAFGIFGQSVGGGGGFASDGSPMEFQKYGVSLGGAGGAGGNGGTVKLTFAGNASITTSGDGADAVFLQSVGGGGGYSGAGYYIGSGQNPGIIKDAVASGNGGYIRVSMADADSSLDIHTTGARADGMFLQSIGGGGGTVLDATGNWQPAPEDGANGSGKTRSGASGSGGPIIVATKGNIQAEGEGSYGIHAETGIQKTDGSIDASRLSGTIDIYHDGKIIGGSGSGAAIRLDGGIDNHIRLGEGSLVKAASDTAIIGSFGRDTVDNYGTVIGDVDLFQGSGLQRDQFKNYSQATYVSAAKNGVIDLGTQGLFENYGSFDVGGRGTIATATLTGNLVGFHDARLLVDVTSTPEPGQARSDLLQVSGELNLNDSILDVNVMGGLRPETFTVATAGRVNGMASATDTHEWSPFLWSASQDGKNLTVRPEAQFYTPDGIELNDTEKDLQAALQETWDKGVISDAGALIYGGFSHVASPEEYQEAIDSTSPEESVSVASTRTLAARTALNAALSCPAFSGAGTSMAETDCLWGRVYGNNTRQSDGAAADGYNRDSVTWRMGVQREVADGWFMGATAGYTWSRLTDNGGYSETNGQAFDASMSLKHEIGPWLFGVAGEFGYGHYKTDRQLDFGDIGWSTSGSSDVITAAGRLRASREFAFPTWYVKPYADVDLLYTYMPSYREHGPAGTGYSFDSARQWNIAFSPNVEFGSRIDLDDNTWLRPYATLGMTYFAKDGMDVTGRMNIGGGDSDFTVHAAAPDLLFNLSAGAQLYRSDSFEVRAEYKADFGRDFVSQEASARLSIPF